MNHDKLVNPEAIQAWKTQHNGEDPPWDRLTDRLFMNSTGLTRTPYAITGTLKGRTFFQDLKILIDGYLTLIYHLKTKKTDFCLYVDTLSLIQNSDQTHSCFSISTGIFTFH